MKSINHIYRIGFIILITVFTVLVNNECKAQSREAVLLKFNPQKQDKYQIEFDAEQAISQDVNGEKMTFTQRVGFGYDMKTVDDLEADKKELNFTYTKIFYDISSPIINLNYNSDSIVGETTMDSLFAKVFGAFKGKKIVVIVQPDGTVDSVTGMEAIVDDIIKSVGDTEVQMFQNFKGQFNDEMLKNQFQQSFRVLPNRKVKKGDKWTIKQSDNSTLFKMNMLNTYTLKEIKEHTVVIDLTSTIQANEDENSAMGKTNMKGKQTGTMIVDRHNGLVLDGKLSQDLSGEMNMMGMKIPFDIQSSILFSSKKVN